MPGLVIRGGTVWGEDGPRRADVLVEGDRIVAVGEVAAGDREVLDATGKHVLPGLIDVHVHCDDRIGDFELADTFASAGCVALTNGITTLGSFVTQRRGETLGEAVERVEEKARACPCRVVLHLTPTTWPWDWNEIAGLVDRGYGTFKLYTTYREGGLFTSYERFEAVMPRLAELGATLLVHCEDDDMLTRAARGVAAQDAAAAHAFLRPAAAENAAVAAIVTIAVDTGCRTHIVHASTPESVEMIAGARRRGPITCETAPHYLLLDRTVLGGVNGHRWLCTPPLRNRASREHLERLAGEGAFDLLATDHCPFSRADKDRFRADARRVPNGVAGIGALMPLAHEVLIGRKNGSLADLVRTISANPARLLGLYPLLGCLAAGSLADLVVLGEGSARRPVVSSLADCHETFPGFSTTVEIAHVVRAGKAVLKGEPGR